MCNNIKQRIRKCSRIVFNWFLFIFNLLNIIVGGTNTTYLNPQPFSYDIPTTNSAYTTESYEPNTIETQIKQFLNVQPLNKSLDHIIKNVFNIENPNPMYIFVLPGEKNKTLVLNRNNFDEAVYPNISAGQRFMKDAVNSKKFFALIDSTTIKDKESDNFNLNLSDLDESESMRIVEENVRTERNFIEFMERLNKAGSTNNITLKALVENPEKVLPQNIMVNKEYEDLVSPKLKHNFQIDYSADLLKPTTEDIFNKAKLEWKDLGLDGWIGSLREPGKDFDAIVTESRTTENTNLISSTYVHSKPKFPNHFKPEYRTRIPEERSTLPSSRTKLIRQKKKNSSQHRRAKSKYNQFHNTHFEHTIHHTVDHQNSMTTYRFPEVTTQSSNINSWEIDMEIPSILTDLLKKENPQVGEIADTLSKIKPKWPVTSSRAEHKDDDVFIARANNPFGHSTKWIWKNSSSDYESENRSKRGALELYSMVKCATGCDPLIFKGYGCYCGFLGSGRTLDGIDRCCKMHDYCYETANCPMFIEYFVPYVWKCYRGRPLCAIDQGEWGGVGSCASRLCDCDQALSKCLRSFYCPRKRAVCASSPWRLLQNVIMEI